jgi:hypothetical protein
MDRMVVIMNTLITDDNTLVFTDMSDVDADVAANEIAASTFLYLLVKELQRREVDVKGVLRNALSDEWENEEVSKDVELLFEKFPGTRELSMGEAIQVIADDLVA